MTRAILVALALSACAADASDGDANEGEDDEPVLDFAADCSPKPFDRFECHDSAMRRLVCAVDDLTGDVACRETKSGAPALLLQSDGTLATHPTGAYGLGIRLECDIRRGASANAVGALYDCEDKVSQLTLICMLELGALRFCTTSLEGDDSRAAWFRVVDSWFYEPVDCDGRDKGSIVCQPAR